MTTVDAARIAAESLREIEDVMARARRFTALSGAAILFSGVLAAAGGVALFFLIPHIREHVAPDSPFRLRNTFTAVWAFVFATSLAVNVWAMRRIGRRNSDANFGRLFRKAAGTFAPSLVVGAALGAYMMARRWEWYALLAPLWMFTYGLGLLAVAPFTVAGVRPLGIAFLTLGVAALGACEPGLVEALTGEARFYTYDHALQLFMAAGFGGLHILFGLRLRLAPRRGNSRPPTAPGPRPDEGAAS
ncbi:MAG: hypothetical protein HY719_16550 [Planctomycetes bacterium]|nr:hypothetical protein [Planctomycetota bacterium]